MIRDLVPVVEGMGIFQLAGLLIFFSFFVILIIWVLRMDKKHIKKMESLPLDKSYFEINLPGEENGQNN
jgi:hypothetical protein